MTKKDYYGVLGIGTDASQVEIKDAFRKLANLYHPDSSGTNDTLQKMKEVNEAYGVLSDSKKKAQYDQFGYTTQYQRYEDVFVTGINEIFNDFSSSILNRLNMEISKIFGGLAGSIVGINIPLILEKYDQLPDILSDNYSLFFPFCCVTTIVSGVVGYKAVEGLQKLNSKYDLGTLFSKAKGKIHKKKIKDLTTILEEPEREESK